MDIEKLIEQLSARGLRNGSSLGYHSGLFDEAATALSTLQAENEKLRAELDEKEKYYDQMIDALAATDSAELEQVKRALAMMWFAYINKSEEFPHSFELEALEKAEHILGSWEKCMLKYLKRGQEEG